MQNRDLGTDEHGLFQLRRDLEVGDAVYQTGTKMRLLGIDGERVIIRPKHHEDADAITVPLTRLL